MYMKKLSTFVPLTVLICASGLSESFAQYTVGSPELVSRATDGGAADNDSDQASPSPNSDIVAFRSSASDLVANDTNEAADIFIRFKNGSSYQIQRVSIGSNGEEANGRSEEPSISQSEAIDPTTRRGTFGVAFSSNATSLAPQALAGNENKQVFLRIPKIGKTFLVSGCRTPSTGSAPPSINGGNGDSTHPSVVSVNDGRKFIIAFTSRATNLIECGAGVGPTTQQSRIFVATIDLDLLDKRDPKYFTLGELAKDIPGDFFEPAISGDGKSIVFVTNSTSSALGYVNEPPPGANSGRFQVVLVQKAGGTGDEIFTLISGSEPTRGANGDSDRPSVSFSGRVVSFRTFAGDIPGIDTTNRFYGLAVRALEESDFGSSFRLANTDSTGAPSNAIETSPQNSKASIKVHPNGRVAVLVDKSTNLDGDPTNNLYKVFLKDLRSGSVKRIDGTQSDADSVQAGLGSGGFNSLISLATFSSNSFNLSTSVGAGSELAAVYRTTITRPIPPLRPQEPIESPPDITVKPRRMDLVFQKFEGFSLSSLGGVSGYATRIVYDVRVHRSGTKKGQRLTSTRNTLTLRDLTPGKYTVRYRAKAIVNGKTKSVSSYSPTVVVVIKSR